MKACLLAQVDAVPGDAAGLSAAGIAGRVWSYELFRVADAAVTVSQVVIALGVLVFGFVAARVISRRVGQRVLPGLRVEPGPASTVQTVLFYVLLTIAALVALQIAAVPLTVFTIFGGAIALAVGFGSQNILNNFISGLILLIERPIQAGDQVSFEGEMGTVRKVGARATSLVTYNGRMVIVPNSKLIESTVTNWNRPDPNLRTSIRIGVAYGSDVPLVTTVLDSLIREHPRTIVHAENGVMFTGFGDSSLDFELHFWIRPASSYDRQAIESDMRLRVEAALRENNITIPFPQRDVHHKPGGPIEVRVLRE